MNDLTRTDRARFLRLAGGLAVTGGTLLGAITLGSSLLAFADPASFLLTIGTAVGATMAIRGPRGLVAMVRATLSSAPREDLERATLSWLMVGGFAMLGGMLGTIIGLVQMLQSLADPSAIGPAMAVALLTQLYGIGTLALSVVAALSCAQRAGTAVLGGLTTASTAAITLLCLGLVPLGALPFFALPVVL